MFLNNFERRNFQQGVNVCFPCWSCKLLHVLCSSQWKPSLPVLVEMKSFFFVEKLKEKKRKSVLDDKVKLLRISIHRFACVDTEQRKDLTVLIRPKHFGHEGNKSAFRTTISDILEECLVSDPVDPSMHSFLFSPKVLGFNTSDASFHFVLCSVCPWFIHDFW